MKFKKGDIIIPIYKKHGSKAEVIDTPIYNGVQYYQLKLPKSIVFMRAVAEECYKLENNEEE